MAPKRVRNSWLNCRRDHIDSRDQDVAGIKNDSVELQETVAATDSFLSPLSRGTLGPV